MKAIFQYPIRRESAQWWRNVYYTQLPGRWQCHCNVIIACEYMLCAILNPCVLTTLNFQCTRNSLILGAIEKIVSHVVLNLNQLKRIENRQQFNISLQRNIILLSLKMLIVDRVRQVLVFSIFVVGSRVPSTLDQTGNMAGVDMLQIPILV